MEAAHYKEHTSFTWCKYLTVGPIAFIFVMNQIRINGDFYGLLRWMCGVTRKDKIRNKHIRGTTKVVQASRKITERRLKWYEDGGRSRSEESDDERKRGRPKTRWKVEGCVQEGHADCRTERGR